MSESDEVQAGTHAPVPKTRLLVSPPEAVLSAPALVEAAVGALQHNDLDGARDRLRAIDRSALWTHWFNAGMEWTCRHSSHTSSAGTSTRGVPTKAVARSVYERDGWRCRYCDLQVIDPTVLRALGTILAADFPQADADRGTHPAILLLSASADHVVPRRIGGDNSADNVVTACGTCQYNKGSCTIDELALIDPRERPPAPDGWTGLTEATSHLSTLDPVPAGTRTAVDFDLEYLIAYGRTCDELPRLKDPDLVAKLVGIYEAALPTTHG
jgi:5-methylcytosine-specific restriction endonuclease McrA